AAASARDVDCLSGIYLPSSFQTGSWLLDHCQESNSGHSPLCPVAVSLWEAFPASANQWAASLLPANQWEESPLSANHPVGSLGRTSSPVCPAAEELAECVRASE
ncbi:Hypothetical predicted protein, partial [Marmota monax]